MNRYHLRGAEVFDEWLGGDAARVAETVRNDFRALLALLDRQLGSWWDADSQTKAHIAEARSAAQRGINLSSQLVERLRSAN